MIRLMFVVAFLSVPGLALAQSATAQHGGMQHGQHRPSMSHEGHGMNAEAFPTGLIEGGQSAFAAIQEIVAQLMADPETDWSRVDIEALRQHLIDMDTLAAVTGTNSFTALVLITNTANAGAITLSGFSKTAGDPFTTTAGDAFFVFIAKLGEKTLASVVALQ